jgi:protein-disulfide isomerase
LSKDAVYGIVIAVFAVLLVVSVFTQGFGIIKPSLNATTNCPACNCPTNTTAQVQPTQPPIIPVLKVAAGKTPAIGSATAPVTIVEFSDFQCPYCSRLYAQAFTQVKNNYVNAGKVKVYFRDYPLSFHPNALPAAVATRCANAQGKFWEMHNKLFETQSAWSSLSDAVPTFTQYAVDLGMNNATFSACMAAPQSIISDISLDLQDAESYSVQGTPAAFIIIPKGKVNVAELKTAIDAQNKQLQGDIRLFENTDEYIVFVGGAYPYQSFDAVLSKVKYS